MPQVPGRSTFSRLHEGIIVSVVMAFSATMFFLILRANDGVFTYTLDDPYIHLALAENIWQGHYGFNAEEFSSPSSSILWPFFLALFAWSTWFMYVPLALNVVATTATLLVVYRMLSTLFAGVEGIRKRTPGLAALTLTLIIAFSTNLLDVMFGGMEHSLHILLCALIFSGLVLLASGVRPPRWFYFSVVLLPLVRFEGIAFALPALLVLWVTGERKNTVYTAGILAALLGGFSFFIYINSGLWLPLSVSVKGWYSYGGFDLMQAAERMFHIVVSDVALSIRLGMTALLPIVIYKLVVNKDLREAGVGFPVVALIMAHFLWLGKIFGRYLLPTVVLTVLTLLYYFRTGIARLFSYSALLGAALMVVLSIMMFLPGYYAMRRLPLAASNIYDHHYQMHRFVTEFYKKPVGANDIGYVGFDNPHFVLDLVGLASVEVFVTRDRFNADRIRELTQKKNVHAVLIYDDWFSDKPKEWIKIGAFVLRKERTSVGGTEVSLYATDSLSVPELRDAMERFAATMRPRTLMPR